MLIKARRFSMHVYILPNLVTTGNLFFGFFSIIQAIKGDFMMAAYTIVVAAIFDLLDGRLARLTRSTSRFGAEYDSLCDLISFGMAPALLLYQWALSPYGRMGWLASFLFVTGGALRLARFNVQSGVVEKAFFQGLPIPMAAGIVASSVLAFRDLGWEPLGHPIPLVMTFLLSIVMVSNFRYRSFKDLDLKQRQPFKWLVLAVVLMVGVAYRPEVNLFLLFSSYATLGAIFGVLKWGKNKRIPHSVYYPPTPPMDRDLRDLVAEEDVAGEDGDDSSPVGGTYGADGEKKSDGEQGLDGDRRVETRSGGGHGDGGSGLSKNS